MSSPSAAPVSRHGPCRLPTPWGLFHLSGFSSADGSEALWLQHGDLGGPEAPLVRLHSACLTGESLFSQRCDCRQQLEMALRMIARDGHGVVIYLFQEGRGIGILNKISAYALQDKGYDTVDANLALGLATDARRYDLAAALLRHHEICRIRLMTNNPDKSSALQDHGITVTARVPLIVPPTAENERYLDVKVLRMGHMSR